jgi:hypothetical protein
LKARVVAAVRTNPVSVERNSLWEKQLLEPLALVERRLYPQLSGTR